MKKILIILCFSFLFLNLYSIEITPTAPYYVGNILTFSPTNPDSWTGRPVRWIFGDGNSIQVTGDQSVTHYYKNPGTYTVMLVDLISITTPNPTQTRVITIDEDRNIQISIPQPYVGQQITFTAINFNTPSDIFWEMGDGTTYSNQSNIINHIFSNAGTYIVKAYDWNGDLYTTPVTITVNITQPVRSIRIYYTSQSPRVDQPIYFETQNFVTSSIDWNFGDGHVVYGGSTNQTYRYQTPGTFTVTAKENLAAGQVLVTTSITILPENRHITISAPEVRINEEIVVTAYNFRGDYIWWDFGDGTQKSGLHTERHVYKRAGNFTITAQDENGESQKKFQVNIIVRGIDDIVNIEIAEIKLDNGKYYKVIPKNSKNIRAVLRMKMRGSGILSGYWIVDGNPYEFFNEVVHQGELKEIFTKRMPGLPVLESGIHTISVKLTKPAEVPITFPVLKYFVLPYENKVEILSPNDGYVTKEKDIPEFSWKEPKGGSKYKVAFSNYLYPILYNTNRLKWIDVNVKLNYKPEPDVWKNIKRNKWTYWKVKAFDSNENIIAESDIQDIKIVIASAEISISKITDLDGNEIQINKNINSDKEDILVYGSVKYKGNSKYLILRVYADNELVDQLLFRDVKKNEERLFETSIPNKKRNTKVIFQVLNTSSPSVIIGMKNLFLKK
jgi:PKD repeat protein